MIVEANEIAYHLEKALYLSKAGRGGPVWLDVPLDIQAAIVDTDDLLYTLYVIDSFKIVEANHHDLLKERWRTESDAFWIKVNQKNLWPDDVEKMIQRLGFVPVYH